MNQEPQEELGVSGMEPGIPSLSREVSRSNHPTKDRSSPDRRLKGMFVPWCSRKPQAVLTSSEMALAACSSFSRSPDDCMWVKEGRNKRKRPELGTNSRHRTSVSYTCYGLPLYLSVVPNHPASEKPYLKPLYNGAAFPCAILFLILKHQASFATLLTAVQKIKT